MFSEICAVYLGIGFCLYEGYQEHSVKRTDAQGTTRTSTSELGYIARSTIRRAIVQTAKVRRQHPLNVANMFPTSSDKAYAMNALAQEIKEYKSGKN